MPGPFRFSNRPLLNMLKLSLDNFSVFPACYRTTAQTYCTIYAVAIVNIRVGDI